MLHRQDNGPLLCPICTQRNRFQSFSKLRVQFLVHDPDAHAIYVEDVRYCYTSLLGLNFLEPKLTQAMTSAVDKILKESEATSTVGMVHGMDPLLIFPPGIYT